jgi:hypothetical protein
LTIPTSRRLSTPSVRPGIWRTSIIRGSDR